VTRWNQEAEAPLTDPALWFFGRLRCDCAWAGTSIPTLRLSRLRTAASCAGRRFSNAGRISAWSFVTPAFNLHRGGQTSVDHTRQRNIAGSFCGQSQSFARYILRIIGAPVMGSVERIAIDCAARSPSILFPFYLQLMVPAARRCCGRGADVCSARDGVRWLTWARPRRSPPARKCMVRMNRSRRPIGLCPKGARTSGAR
jgi:hypothetical protein